MAFQMVILAKTIYGLILAQMVTHKGFVETKSSSLVRSYKLTRLLVFCGPMVVTAKENTRFWVSAAVDRTLPVILTNSALPA